MYLLFSSLLTTSIHWTLTYRLTFLLNRLRNVLSLVFVYFVWRSAYAQSSNLFGYSYEEMIQYLLLATILSSFLSFGYTADIGGEILSGQIINYLLKPFNYITFAFLKELSQKTINLLFVCLEVSIFIFIIQTFPTFHITAIKFFEFLVFFVLSILLSFNISFIISLSGFWSPEVWGPRFVYTVFMSIVAGTLFPLDILPPLVYKILLFTPLPYLFFIPAKILVKNVPELSFALSMSVMWTVLSCIALQLLWKKGLKEYGFYGR